MNRGTDDNILFHLVGISSQSLGLANPFAGIVPIELTSSYKNRLARFQFIRHGE